MKTINNIDLYRLGRLRLDRRDGKRKLYFSYRAVFKLIDVGIGMLHGLGYRPGTIICIPNGAAHFASQVGDCYGMNPAYLPAASYDHTSPASAGVQRGEVAISSGIGFVSKGGSFTELPNPLTGEVLFIDDLRQSGATGQGIVSRVQKGYGCGFNPTMLFLVRKKYHEDEPPLPPNTFAAAELAVNPQRTTEMPWVVWPWETDGEKLRKKYPWPE